MRKFPRRHRLIVEITDQRGLLNQGQMASVVHDFLVNQITFEEDLEQLEYSRFTNVKVKDYNRAMASKARQLAKRVRRRKK